MAQTGASRDSGLVVERDPASIGTRTESFDTPSASDDVVPPSVEPVTERSGVTVSLDAVLVPAELLRTADRATDWAAENAALHAIGRSLHDSPHDVLGAFLEVARSAVDVASAGVCLLETSTEGYRQLRWARMTGVLSAERSSGSPFEETPLGVCLAHDEPRVFDAPGRLWPSLAKAGISELLTLPFRDRQKEPIGVVWFARHASSEDGEDRPSPRFDAEHLRFLGALVNFTAHIYAAVSEQKERERLHAAERFAHTELAAVCERLRSADSRKDEFLAMLGHELRNPLGAIANAVALLESQPDPSPRSKTLVDVVRRQTGVMTQLLDDLLDVSRITLGKLELRRSRTDLAYVVHHVVGNLGKQAATRRHALDVEVEADLSCNVDPTRIEQVVSNLLTNAIKYTDPGGHIRITASRIGDDVVLRISDDGLGIPKSFLPHVFDLFSQGGMSNSRAHGGLGLGLALVRKIVELHGGSVEARSEGPGAGSEFIVKLPAADAHGLEDEGRVADARDVAVPVRRMRVLVVDDDVDSAALAGEMLTLLGHDAQVVNDSESALQMASRCDWDLILLDIGLPGIDGYEVSRRLRMGRHEKARLVAVSGFGGLEDRYRSMAAGCDEHLVKPVGMADLRSVLARALEATAVLRERN